MTIRVLLVDDAVVVRHILSDTLARDPEISVIGTAPDGEIALQMIRRLQPDVVVLDVEMPNMDGIEALAVIKRTWPTMRVIMFSTLTARGAAATMDALMLGADDYVTKPANVGSVSAAIDRINAELAPRIKALYRSPGRAFLRPAPTPLGSGAGMSPGSRNAERNAAFQVPQRKASGPASPDSQSAGSGSGEPLRSQQPSTSSRAAETGSGSQGASSSPSLRLSGSNTVQIVTIAVSTGGPNALAVLLPTLPADLPVPIVIVQHIPAMFSKALADRLDSKSAIKVAECQPGAQLEPGHVWIAPGDYHMTVQRDGSEVRVDTNQGPPENSCRPAADVLFRSVAAAYGKNALGLVLTGMGNDGLKGSDAIVKAGGTVLVQDEATSVVWGMPGAVASAGLASAVLPLESIAGELVARIGASFRGKKSVPTNNSQR